MPYQQIKIQDNRAIYSSLFMLYVLALFHCCIFIYVVHRVTYEETFVYEIYILLVKNYVSIT